MNQLEKIIDYKRQEVVSQKLHVSLRDLKKRVVDTEPARPYLANFNKSDINIIAEIKKASPSAGVIREDFNPVDIAHIYKDGGAKALSVLTDEHFFQGHLEYLQKVKAAVSLPVLRKDFTLNEYHIFQGRAHGADAILLIVAVLDPHQVIDYVQMIAELGMTALVEVHNQSEWDFCIKNNFKFIGINNRNLKTFKTDIETTSGLIATRPNNATIISESGLKNYSDLIKLKQQNVDGFLIGESFMKADDIGAKLREFLGET